MEHKFGANVEDQNNGHNEEEQTEQAFKGAILNVNELKREDGILTRTSPNYQSLLHRVISAVSNNKDYRNELKTALWASSDEADMAVAAIWECDELGMDPTPIIDQIIARSAGRNHELLYEALRTLTHSTFTTNYQGKQNARQNSSRSPISG